MIRLPAEWARQQAVMLTWPHADGDWDAALGEVEAVFMEIARHVAARENLIVACHSEELRARLRAELSLLRLEPHDIELYVVPSNDVWARDHGPLTVLDNDQPLLLDFRFNGWGGKYPAGLDNQVTQRLHELGAFGSVMLRPIEFVLEGGSIETDGEGTLLTTSRCLLSTTRNPGLDRTAIEHRLREYLGVDRVLWLDHGYLAGDDTDGHIDTLARFCSRDTIAYVSCADPRDEHAPELRAMEGELKQLATREGRAYHLVPLPLPRPVRDDSGRRLPATYANFLVINDAVLVPTYDDPADAEALRRLGRCFPRREVIGIDCRALLRQYGSLHCASMQIPGAVR